MKTIIAPLGLAACLSIGCRTVSDPESLRSCDVDVNPGSYGSEDPEALLYYDAVSTSGDRRKLTIWFYPPIASLTMRDHEAAADSLRMLPVKARKENSFTFIYDISDEKMYLQLDNGETTLPVFENEFTGTYDPDDETVDVDEKWFPLVKGRDTYAVEFLGLESSFTIVDVD